MKSPPIDTNGHELISPVVRELAVESLSFGYEDRMAVDDISLRMAAGERIAVVGPNGCGKSTLLKLIVGGLQPRAGRITLDGKGSRDLGRIDMAQRIALVPQMAGGDAGLDAGMGGLGGGFLVRQIVLMARYASHAAAGGKGLAGLTTRLGMLGFETANDMQIANESMWSMDVHHLAEREVAALSGGERQRVAIARALAQRTPVLLLDEPTSALDLYHQLELLALLEEQSAAGKLVVLVTHDLNLAAHWATRIVLLDQGRLAADGKPHDVLAPAVLEPVYRVNVECTPDGTLVFRRAV